MAVSVQKYDTADNNMLEKCGHAYKMITGYLSFTTYITDGVPMDISLDIPNRVDLVLADAMGGYTLKYDYTNRKMLVYMVNGATASDGPLIQVADTTDLSKSVSNCHFMAVGK